MLIGMPPSPEEVDAFLNDDSPDAYERVVDRLLKSPRYGERWAAPWLDLARYADSNGFQADQFRDNWAYRDWVIRAMNADMPFDEFVIDQLAGDLRPNATLDQRIRHRVPSHDHLQCRGGRRPRGESDESDRRSRQYNGHGILGHDHGMRAVSRSQK